MDSSHWSGWTDPLGKCGLTGTGDVSPCTGSLQLISRSEGMHNLQQNTSNWRVWTPKFSSTLPGFDPRTCRSVIKALIGWAVCCASMMPLYFCSSNELFTVVNYQSTVTMLSFPMDKSGQTMLTQIRLLLKELWYLHCLPFWIHLFDALVYDKITLCKF